MIASKKKKIVALVIAIITAICTAVGAFFGVSCKTVQVNSSGSTEVNVEQSSSLEGVVEVPKKGTDENESVALEKKK